MTGISRYYEDRQFYSPVYQSDVNEIPDHRATVYWNPEVITDSIGEANFSFYTSDDHAPLLLFIEGISLNGKPGVGFLKLNMGGNY